MQYNSAQPGATRADKSVWSDGEDSFLFHIDPSPESVTWAKTFERTGLVIRTLKSENPWGTWVIATWEYEVKEITANACYELTDVT